MSRPVAARVAVVALMVVWGTTYFVTKSAIDEAPPMVFALLRFLVATAVLLPVALLRGGRARLPRPVPLGTLALMGLAGFALYYAGFNYALVYGSASQGALIQALFPAAIALGAMLFLGERPPRRRIAGIALSVAGVAMIVAAGAPDESSRNPLLGAAFMLTTVVSWTVYTILAKRLAHADQIAVTAAVTAIGTAMMIPFALVELAGGPWPSLSREAWLAIVYLGVVASAGAYLVYNGALRELDASEVAVYVNLVPVVGVLTAAAVLGETLQPWQIVGAVVALAGMWLSS